MATRKVYYDIVARDKGTAAVKKLQTGVNRLSRDVKRTNVELKRMNATAQRMGAMMGRIGGLLAAAFSVRTVKRALDFADAIGKQAAQLGLSTDALQKFQHGAELAGVSSDKLGLAIAKFQRNLADVDQGFGEFILGAQRLGLATRDMNGNFKSTEVLLNEFADALAAVPDQAERMQIALQAFGRGGMGMLSFLEDGSAGLKEMGDEAVRLGLILDSSTIAAAERINDQFTRLANIARTKILPAFVAVADFALQVALGFGKMQDAVQESAAVMTALFVPAVALASAAIAKLALVALANPFLAIATAALAASAVILANWDKVALFFAQGLPAAWQIAVGAAEAFSAAVRAKMDDTGNSIVTAFRTAINAVITMLNTASTEVNKFSTGFAKGFAGAFGIDVDLAPIIEPIKLLNVEMDKSTSLLRSNSKMLVHNMTTLEQGAAAWDRYREASAALGDSDADATKMTDTMDRLATATDKVAGASGGAGKAIKKMAEKMSSAQEDMKKLADTAGDALGTMFGDMITGAKSAKEAFKNMAQSILTMLAKLAAQKLIGAIFGGGFGGGGGGFLSGLFGGSPPPPVTGGFPAPPPPIGFAPAPPPAPPVGRATSHGGGGVIVNNFSTARVTAAQDDAGNTQITIEEVTGAVAQGIAAGGSDVALAMERTYGVNRAGAY